MNEISKTVKFLLNIRNNFLIAVCDRLPNCKVLIRFKILYFQNAHQTK